ncbi:NAD(P)H-dependent glycerol-3-phosphate dehydrogenase [Marinimicrobium sp. ABcell2]|uniref:NAD(P)H-dependent glycerol-3-phosphate dehydrogenase n=1 Tax=Marinimicrobium sp. ABcell2 TaxID=3069751 RepID=UPI0027B5CA07|nr:NAD(P)H-dependent glycerol-3-phosphate dehydrogenase [Marinimicrobium sp. ABcell2]MDQ2075514.1 NAD(P)H-dependent glycerol-3-phosphate dehydrogenase [Marinimicrobium sp. ABcell2]
MTEALTWAVLGGGSFGTAIANILAANGLPTYLWMRDSEKAERCQRERENAQYLPGYPFVDALTATGDLELALKNSQVVFLSVPTHGFRGMAKEIRPWLRADAMVISTAKGIEPEGFTLMSQILEQELPDHRYGVLSGPNFAKEIVARQHTGTVIASEHAEVVEAVQKSLRSETFRVYSNSDRYGVELGGALKNIYAIICGMAAAVGAGHNTQAMLLTRSLAEMGRFASAMGANPMTFLGLAGVGDLILTCTSNLSRNYQVGYALGQGKPLSEVVAGLGQVAEGVNTLKQTKQKADEMGIYMPLMSGLYGVLFEGKAIPDVVRQLMLGEQSHDVEYMGVQ